MVRLTWLPIYKNDNNNVDVIVNIYMNNADNIEDIIHTNNNDNICIIINIYKR